MPIYSIPVIKYRSNMIRRILASCLVAILLAPVIPAAAQTSGELPTYVVQPGDTINTIAIRFGISAQDLIDANQINDVNFLSVGSALNLPGFDGINGQLTTVGAPLGATFNGLVNQYHISQAMLVKLNKIVSPSQVFAGSTLILPVDENNPPLTPSAPVPAGQSLLEFALAESKNPWLIALTNQTPGTWNILPGEPLYSAATGRVGSMFGSDLVNSIQIDPLPLVQGATEVITIHTTGPAELSGSLDGNPLVFFQSGENEYVALQGIHGMADLGLVDFSLKGSASGKAPFTIRQSVLLGPGYFPEETINVDPSFLDPAVTAPEDEQIKTITANTTPQKYWTGIFNVPLDEPICVYSGYGTRRSYNDGPYDAYHTGIDYGVCSNLNIYAPADGKVVFVGQLTVRGQATIIDHGWGVYSAYWHQSATYVQVGDSVKAGDLIGEIGATGRVTGPHLHWEIWVNGVQVNPQDWLDNAYPE